MHRLESNIIRDVSGEGHRTLSGRWGAGMFDDRLLGPGWGGDISDDEVCFIQEELLKDKKLAYQWGFAPSKRTRPADAIRRVAMEGDAVHRNANVPLTRPQPNPTPETQPLTPPKILTLWAYAGIDVPNAAIQLNMTKASG